MSSDPSGGGFSGYINEARYRAIFVRASRDECLEWSDSKAIAAADAPAGIRTRIDAWAAYRQALRDVPQ